jgi:sulfur-carrier protein
VIVRLPGLLDRYTGGQREHEVAGQTVADALAVLEERFPGIRFRLIDEHERVRTHIRIFVGQDSIEDLTTPVPTGREVFVIGALSGG